MPAFGARPYATDPTATMQMPSQSDGGGGLSASTVALKTSEMKRCVVITIVAASGLASPMSRVIATLHRWSHTTLPKRSPSRRGVHQAEMPPTSNPARKTGTPSTARPPHATGEPAIRSESAQSYRSGVGGAGPGSESDNYSIQSYGEGESDLPSELAVPLVQLLAAAGGTRRSSSAGRRRSTRLDIYHRCGKQLFTTPEFTAANSSDLFSGT